VQIVRQRALVRRGLVGFSNIGIRERHNVSPWVILTGTLADVSAGRLTPTRRAIRLPHERNGVENLR
jgi:hypothetical protein